MRTVPQSPPAPWKYAGNGPQSCDFIFILAEFRFCIFHEFIGMKFGVVRVGVFAFSIRQAVVRYAFEFSGNWIVEVGHIVEKNTGNGHC